MPLSKTISANGSKGHHKFTLEVTESSTSGNSSFLDFTFKLSPLSNGWDWNSWGNKISYSITIGSNTYTGTIPAYNGTSTVTLKSESNIEIPHEEDGTKTITISFGVTDTTGVNYTCGNANSSGTFQLTDLHKPPAILACSVSSENNTVLTNLTGFQKGTVVQHLSNKTFTITVTPYDDATITKYEIYHAGTKIGESASNTITINFASLGELQTVSYNPPAIWLPLLVAVTDSLGGYTEKIFYYSIIQYAKPNIERASTSIRRKSGGGTTLTDNKAVLNLIASFYKEDNVVGNNNSINKIGYKVWEKNTSEPANYTTLTPTVSGGNISISNLELSNLIYTKTYNYKIILKDYYAYQDVIEGTIPTGQSVWTEYKDHVDFLKITIQGEDILDVIQRMINNS